MKKIDEKAIIRRIRRLRTSFAGERGRSKFARALGISPSTYSYYEDNRMPPIETLLAICEVTGADLEWLLTGRESTNKGGYWPNKGAKSLAQRVSVLLREQPDLTEPLEAFIDLLCEKKGIEKQLSQRQSPPVQREKGWIPVLGRTAAGIVHCWDETALPDSSLAVTSLDSLVKQYTGRDVVRTTAAPVAVDFELKELSDAVADAQVSLMRTPGDSQGKVVEFVDCEKLYRIFPDCFALHVDGDSMSPRINDGDIVIASPSVPAVDGQVAVAHIANQIGVTCKLIRTTPQGVHLIPINEKYETKIVPRKDLLWALSVLCHVNL